MRALLIIAMFACTGCANMSATELTWQSLHAIDVAQTINHGSDPCYREGDPLTNALIGDHPNAGEVIAWGVATSIVHYSVSRTLENLEAPRWLQNTWASTTIGLTASTIASNHSMGVRPWGDNKGGYPGCTS